jgi:hypothetical protein
MERIARAIETIVRLMRISSRASHRRTTQSEANSE